MRKIVRKFHTPVMLIANTCSTGYPHDCHADNAAYRHERRGYKIVNFISALKEHTCLACMLVREAVCKERKTV